MSDKKKTKRVRIGVVDTMFARYDMGAAARDELSHCPGYGTTFEPTGLHPGAYVLRVALTNRANGHTEGSSVPFQVLR